MDARFELFDMRQDLAQHTAVRVTEFAIEGVAQLLFTGLQALAGITQDLFGRLTRQQPLNHRPCRGAMETADDR